MSKKPSPSHNQPVWTTTIDYRPPPQEEDRDIEERPVSRHTYYYNNVEYENENLNQGYIEDDSNRRRFQRAFDEDSEFVERHTNISIPRPKVYGRSGREVR
ncbi:unnamed protein product [Bursaphelenchus okinawaensis]|uniref:Uncharacterized protein n=1 Tax=Bursaphelenchus okinawaensis TaxID=465554 RepID=A0A811KFX1_9BILA|nr:unnamed protein product [Bursaphelenchus okinawaensis]CAG9102383.1 unnamed protein product [Bursaphelenchus okinawaensis]